LADGSHLATEHGSSLRSASALVADSLRRAIYHGEIRGGDRVMQDAVATRFGVSQTIVREAFGQLVAEGLLRSEPRRGVTVARMTPEDAEELVRLRSAVEVQALEWAIPVLSDADIQAAKRLLDQLEQADSADEVLRLNALFHDALYAPSKRERTLGLVNMLRLSFDRYFRFVYDETKHVPKSQQEHRKLLKLCEARDAKGACELLRQHIVGTGAALAKGLKTSA
jgi:DNA-binding GntR family transcriptional regulator